MDIHTKHYVKSFRDTLPLIIPEAFLIKDPSLDLNVVTLRLNEYRQLLMASLFMDEKLIDLSRFSLYHQSVSRTTTCSSMWLFCFGYWPLCHSKKNQAAEITTLYQFEVVTGFCGLLWRPTLAANSLYTVSGSISCWMLLDLWHYISCLFRCLLFDVETLQCDTQILQGCHFLCV